jgi:hypothetical protein
MKRFGRFLAAMMLTCVCALSSYAGNIECPVRQAALPPTTAGQMSTTIVSPGEMEAGVTSSGQIDCGVTTIVENLLADVLG